MRRSFAALSMATALLAGVVLPVPAGAADCPLELLLDTGFPPGSDVDGRWFNWDGEVGGPAWPVRAVAPRPGWYVPDPAWTTARWVVPDIARLQAVEYETYNFVWADPPGGSTGVALRWAADYGAEVVLNGWVMSPYADGTASSLHFGNWSSGPWIRDGAHNWLQIRVRVPASSTSALFAAGRVRFCT